MGTTAQKLQAVLNAKNAIKAKFNLPDNLPFSQYADNINAGTGGGETAFYKCASVGSNDDSVIMVSGAGDMISNGNYWKAGIQAEFADPTLSDEYKRIWQMPVPYVRRCIYYDPATTSWWISEDYNNHEIPIYGGATNAPKNPWEGGAWEAGEGTEPAPTVTPEETEKVWNGYKAVLVEEEITTEGETVVVVSGATSMPAANGTYRQSNTETGQSAIYTSEDGQFRLFMEEVMYGHWCIMKGENNYDGVYYSQRSGTNPWDSGTTDWTYESSDIMNEYPTGKPESLTVTQETLEGSTEIKKYYDFEETLTTGLTYGYGFVPEKGKIYDAEAMIQATLFENIPLISTPENMTSHENTDWIVSAHSEYGSYYAWKAFDNDLGTKWDHNSSAFWIQWQNKNAKVLIKQLIARCGDTYGLYGDKCYLQGSDDGEHWVDIARGDWSAYRQAQDGLQVYTLTFPDNETSYFYHRLGNDAGGVNAKIHEMIAYSKIQ